jgi:DNA processing protein
VADPDPRSLRIALAASPAVSHPAACRLATELELWVGGGAGAAPAVALGVPSAALAAALDLRTRAREVARRVEREAAGLGARVAAAGDIGYPPTFGALDLPPPAVWIAGEPEAATQGPAVAIVGARKASPYGLEMAAWLARGAAEGGARVISGFAVGVDAAAHRGALEASGRTVAVLGCGLEIDYPRGHRALGAEIRRRGALVTEFPPRHGPRGWQFPIRNRLIAALAAAVVVVEAAPRSGSLVTARLALELGRDLLAVPGRVTDELALGPNALLADGAAPALTPGDLLDAIGLPSPGRDALRAPPGETAHDSPSTAPVAGLGDAARALWEAAGTGSAGAETLAARAGLPVEQALSALLELEIAGRLRRSADARYVRC